MELAFGVAIAAALIAELISPRRRHLPVCLNQDYWQRKAAG